MRYLLTIILGLFLWTGCNDDDETLVPSTEPEFRYVLPQGNHDYDTKIVNWYEDCGFYILYKYEDKDVFYNEWCEPQNNILWKTTGFRAIIYALPSLCKKGIRDKDLTQKFFTFCFQAFKTKLSKQKLSLTSKDFPGGSEQIQRRLARFIVDSIADINIEQYNNNLLEIKDIQEFIDNIIDINKYELYDIAEALDKKKTSYETLKVVPVNGDVFKLINPYTDVFIEIKNDQAHTLLKDIQNKYMLGMDYESWLAYKESLEKDD